MLFGFLTRFEKVCIAATPEEKRAVQRLRYEVYVGELRKGFLKNIDHESKLVVDPEDDRPDSTIFYTGTPEKVTGTLRIDNYQPGAVPAAFRELFSLALLPALATQPVCEFSRLIISKKQRGLLILPALARAAYPHICRTLKTRYAFIYCAPGLVNAYRKLGFRPYGGHLIFNQDGVRVPMIGIFSDVDYISATRSPIADLAKKFFKRTHPEDLKPVQHLLEESAAYKLDDEAIWGDVQEALATKTSGAPSFLDRLPEDTLKWLTKRGFVIDVPEGQKMVREDLVEEEMFLILDGLFEVKKGDRRVALLGQGDIFGEMAFFLENKQRTASVFSVSPGRILVLRRKFLNELIKENPQLANDILFSLCQTLVRRLAVAAPPAAF